MPVPLVVTKRYGCQRVTSWWQPATQTNGDQNRDKILARSNQPRTSETYRRQDDVFGYELQFLLSGVLPGFQNCLMCCPAHPPKKVIKSDSKRFLAIRRLDEDKLCDTLQAMAPTDNVKTVHQTSLFHIENNLDRLG